MSFRLLSISTMYPGALELFYRSAIDHSSNFTDLNNLLLNSTTEFVASYTKNFRKLGINADAIVANDLFLQSKWKREHSIKSNDHLTLLMEQAIFNQPDVLFIENLGSITERWIEEARKNIKSLKLIAGYHCAPLNKNVTNVVGSCDIIFTCTPGLKSFFDAYGKKTFLVYHGFDEDNLSLLKPIPEDDNLKDIIFSGSLTTGGNFHNDRIRLIENILQAGIDIGLYVNLESSKRIKVKQLLYFINKVLIKTGFSSFSSKLKIMDNARTRIDNYSGLLLSKSLPPVFGSEMLNLFRNSKIVLNYHIGVAGNFAGNMRMFEVTGTGSCLLTDNKVNMNDLFTPGIESVVYDNKNDCIEKIKWLLDHEEERRLIAEAGQKRTLTTHTVSNRAKTIADIIGNELNNLRLGNNS